jgi:transposase
VIVIPRAVRVYFATAPVSLRKSFEGLSNEVRAVLAHDPLGGHVFVFLNRRRNQVKLLVWTRGGYTIVHKRLERGKFVFASQVTSNAKSVELDVHELSMLLEGIDVTRAKTSARWDPPKRSRVA